MGATSTGSGSLETAFSYGAWGTVAAGSAVDNSLDYGGGWGYWHDATLGLSYVRARWMNPSTGSWLSVDPVSSEPRYSYVHNMPTAHTDPSGRQQGMVEMPYYLLGKALADSPAYKTGVKVGVAHGFAAGWDAFVKVLVDSNEPAWYKLVESAAIDNQAGMQKVKAVVDPSTMAVWKSFTALIPIGLPLAPSIDQPDFIRYGGGLMWGLTSSGLHFLLDTPADIVRLVQMIGWIFKPGKALNELGSCVSTFIYSLAQLAAGIDDMPAYDRGKLVGSAIIAIIGLLLMSKGIIEAAKNIPVLLRKAVSAAKNLRASIGNAKLLVGISQVLTKTRTPEAVYAAAATEAQRLFKAARVNGKALEFFTQTVDAKMLRQLEELGVPAAVSAAARDSALRSAAKKLLPEAGYFDFVIHGAYNSEELWFVIGKDAKGEAIWSHGGDYRV